MSFYFTLPLFAEMIDRQKALYDFSALALLSLDTRARFGLGMDQVGISYAHAIIWEFALLVTGRVVR
jgi:hypothetical protein